MKKVLTFATAYNVMGVCLLVVAAHKSWPKSYSQQAVRKGQHIVELSHSDYH